MSNLGKWDSHYVDVREPMHYGDSVTYRIGAEWLADCAVVEDWGCGLGWFKQFCKRGYRGVDGSHSRFADVIADLETYTSDVDGIFMRHVLEHNYNWPTVLHNALASFRQRMALIIFTPFSDGGMQLSFEEEYGVPTLALDRLALWAMLQPYDYTHDMVESPETFYGQEHVVLIEKP